MLLHNGKRYVSLPIDHFTKLKKDYDNIKTVLQKLDDDFRQWLICVDLKMVDFLLGQESGYTKYPCCICLWRSRARDDHWIKKGWPPRDSMRVSEANVINEPLAVKEKIILPPLFIKLVLMKQFVKTLPCNWGLLQLYLQSINFFDHIETLKASLMALRFADS